MPEGPAAMLLEFSHHDDKLKRIGHSLDDKLKRIGHSLDDELKRIGHLLERFGDKQVGERHS